MWFLIRTSKKSDFWHFVLVAVVVSFVDIWKGIDESLKSRIRNITNPRPPQIVVVASWAQCEGVTTRGVGVSPTHF